jgi:putative heme iron utilization protein
VALTELRKSRSRVIRNGGGMTIIRHPDAVSIDLNTAEIAATAKRAAETAASVAGRRIEEISRVFDEMGRGFGGATIRWEDDELELKPVASTSIPTKRTVIRM